LFHDAPVNSVGSSASAEVEEQPMASTPETQTAPGEINTEEPVLEETLVEEVSIDGMCGVY
jgi:mycofactocin precursor